MPISGLPLFDMLKTRMQWHQARQRVLAQNVANADLPRFKPQDLRAPSFDGPNAGGASGVRLAATQAGHLTGTGEGASARTANATAFETTPSGNAVQLEDEMMKVAQNQMDYQMATGLYAKSLSIMKLAVGRR